MWDPARYGHFCDRCDAYVDVVGDEFRLSLYGSGGAPMYIPDEFKSLVRGLGFKAPMFCHLCVLPIMELVFAHCKEFKKQEKERAKEVHPTGGSGS